MAITISSAPDHRPGLHPRRLVVLMREAIERCRLDLTGRVVLTEAASGAYIITPVLSAMAGAERVYAITKTTAYGTVEEVTAQTQGLAAEAGVADRIFIEKSKSRDIVALADIITNSGHVRPIDSEMISCMKPGAVVPLMYEAWEFRSGDIDLDACRQRGIKVAGTNERHPAIDVFSFLGMMAVKLLLDAGIAVRGSRILILCDNPFAPYLERGLAGAGAEVITIREEISFVNEAGAGRQYDAILVAFTPGAEPVIGSNHAIFSAREIAKLWPCAVITQFWGDLDRDALSAEEVPYWPTNRVPPGHMGILPEAVGPEPVIRLQCGGLKVGEVLARGAYHLGDSDAAFLQVM